MRVEIDDDVFADARTPQLFGILLSGFLGRHRVFVEDGSRYREWRNQLDKNVVRDIDASVAASTLIEAREPARHEIRVRQIEASRWSSSTPELTVNDAVHLLARPFRLLLEHRRADLRFLLAMCTPADRSFLEARIEKDWIEVETCGGITEVEVRATELRKSRSSSTRAAALCDSDALEPGILSEQARLVKLACEREGAPGEPIHHHVLGRRTIENYLPEAVLESWRGRARASDARKRDDLVKEFSKLTREQKSHFPMKKGLNGDKKRIDGSGPLFASLSNLAKRRLAEGFGAGIATETLNAVTEAMLRRDGSWAELRPFVVGLIASVR